MISSNNTAVLLEQLCREKRPRVRFSTKEVLMKEFKFKLGQRVRLALSEEYGNVVGRAEYLDDGSRYYVRYRNAQGCQTEEWFTDSGLVAAADAS